MTPKWEPVRENLRKTILRNLTIASVTGFIVSLFFGGLRSWSRYALLALWPSLGGHFVEIFFLNFVQQNLPVARTIQVAARLVTWYLGGAVIGVGIRLTAEMIGIHPRQRPAWWLGGVGLIAIELLVHIVLAIRRKPSFYSGRG